MKKRKQSESCSYNKMQISHDFYFFRLLNIALSEFRWNLPLTIDALFLERKLFECTKVLFFVDDVSGDLRALPFTEGGTRTLYNEPNKRRAYSINGYKHTFTPKNSVIVYSNPSRVNDSVYIDHFARRLAKCDALIDLNLSAQRTPYILRATEDDKLTLLNMYKQVEDFEPVIKTYKSLTDEGIQVLSTVAPFVADRIRQEKNAIWGEALSWLGVPTLEVHKTERTIRDEISASNGGTLASRNARLLARQEACEKVRGVLGFDISVDYAIEGGENNV